MIDVVVCFVPKGTAEEGERPLGKTAGSLGVSPSFCGVSPPGPSRREMSPREGDAGAPAMIREGRETGDRSPATTPSAKGDERPPRLAIGEDEGSLASSSSSSPSGGKVGLKSRVRRPLSEAALGGGGGGGGAYSSETSLTEEGEKEQERRRESRRRRKRES